jgi:hypothetical protein
MNTIVLPELEYNELLKIKEKYDALIAKSVIFLSNSNIYCRLCNSLSKNNGNIINHIYKHEKYFEEIKNI